MNTGLFLLRRVSGLTPAVLDELLALRQLYEFEDGSTFVADDVPRDVAVTDDIVDHTVGWGMFDSDLHQHAFYSRLDKAQRALQLAQPRIVTEVELPDEEPEVEAEPEAKPRAKGGRPPVVRSAIPTVAADGDADDDE